MFHLICCGIGIALLILSIILCVFTDRTWVFILAVGEVIAFLGYAPILLKFLG